MQHSTDQGWELGISTTKLQIRGRFQEVVYRKYFVWPFLSIFENLTEFWPNLRVIPHAGI